MNSKKIKELFAGYEAVGERGVKHFAVLIPLVVSENDDLSLLFEVRSSEIDRQPGEICFPGGMIEEGEAPLESALRETQEETGITEDSIEVIAKMPSISVANSSQLHVFLGMLSQDSLKKAEPSPDEVAELFTVELKHFMENAPEIYTVEMEPHPDENFPCERVTGKSTYPWKRGRHMVPVYEEAKGHVIWGLTARIIRQLIEDIKILQNQ